MELIEAIDKFMDLKRVDTAEFDDVKNRIQEAFLAEEIIVNQPTNTSIYVMDKQDGSVRRIGTNHHDMLTIDKDNELCYLNLQNGDMAMTGRQGYLRYGYCFVPNEDDHGYNFNPMEGQNEQNG